VLVLGLSLSASATEPAPDADKNAGESADRKDRDAKAIYRPPVRGNPRGRVGGGVRGVGAGAPVLFSLVPEHTGQTLAEQPSLFWYLDGAPPPQAAIVFALTDEAHIDPLIEVELGRPERGGIQRIDLSGRGVRLAPGTEYEWSVALVVDPERRSSDVVTVGWIERVEAPADLPPDVRADVRRLAASGLWYDALATASDRVAAAPADPAPRVLRNQLLREVGLDFAADPLPRGGN